MFTNRTSLIIPTKNRSSQIIKLINRLYTLNLDFNDLLIIDSSNDFPLTNNVKCKIRNIKYYKTKS